MEPGKASMRINEEFQEQRRGGRRRKETSFSSSSLNKLITGEATTKGPNFAQTESDRAPSRLWHKKVECTHNSTPCVLHSCGLREQE